MDQIQWPGWEVTRLIGNGNFGSVYEIERNLYGNVEKAALKVIHLPQSRSDIEELYNDGFDDESITARFNGYLEDIIREYSMMASLKGNKNVVYCDDVRQIQHEDGIGWDIYIKMELLTPLVKTLGKEISEEQVINIGVDMCSALVMCKDQNIVHRDIKPQNIFVSKDGVYKLGDFGIAKTAERTTSGTKTGTYKYMAPEVYKSMPYGAAADQYSLGMVLYWLLNERRTPSLPLPSKVKATTVTMEDEARKRRFDGEQLPPPAHGSKQLQSIVLKACAYDPKDRFASAAEMLEALKALKGDISPVIVTVPNGETASVAGGVAASVAADELTSGTVGRKRESVAEEGTIGAFGTGAAFAAWRGPQRIEQPIGQPISANNTSVQPVQQTNRQYSAMSVTAPQDKPEEKKKNRGFAAWIAVAAGLVVVIAGILLLTLGKNKTNSNQGNAGAALNSGSVEQTSSVTESGTTNPIQLDWADWDENLPDYVTDENYDIEERTLYSFRNLETTSSTTSSSMDGWELYDTATGNGDYGAWSDWSKTAVSKSDTRDVETQTRYRYSDKETTTSSSSSKSGWTLDNTTYSWGDYGSWSQWSTNKAAKSDSRDVQTETRYRYRDKETTTSSNSSMSGWTLDNTTYSWGDYGAWSQWSTDKVSNSDGREIQTEKRYRFRDKETTTSYNTSLSGWSVVSYDWVESDQGTIRYVSAWPGGFNRSHSLFSEYNNTPVSSYESNTAKTVIDSTGVAGYIYYHWCRGTYSSGPINRKTNEVQTGEFRCFHTFYSTSSAPRYDPGGADGQNSRYYPNASTCRDSYWYYPISVNFQHYTSYKKLFHYERWNNWSTWSTTAVSGNNNCEVQTATFYRYRDRTKTPTYHFSRWKNWSSWSADIISGNDNREVQTATYYRYRDRSSIPTYHFSRWKDWSAWSDTVYTQSDSRKVETATFYRYRDRVTQTTYYFQRWTEWSDYTESPVDESDTVEVETKTQYRYKSKET